jgi:pectate lyase
VFCILLLFQLSICIAAESPDSNESTKYLDAVREFADNVLKYGRDMYGPKHTPLFVDGLNIHTHEPVKWIAPNGDRWILSNLASQQNLFRTLDGLTRITGDPKYKQAAMEAIEYAFANLRSPNGLLYWGGHAAYDVGADKPCGGRTHELKAFYAYYELMWKVDPQATKQFIESFWSAHILDWSNLDMNRHGDLKEPLEEPWRRDYEGGPVFFEGNGITFATTGSDLYYAAAILSKLSGKKDPLIWAKRLAYRYVETRDPKTRISSYLYSLPKNPPKHPLADDFKGHMVHSGILFPPGIEQILDPKVRKCTLGSFTVNPGIPCTSLPNPWICSFLIGELLGEESREFTRWALEELTARGRVAYRITDNVWIPMLPDGTSLEGYAYKKDVAYGPKGTVFKPIYAVPMDLWGYALAYRLTSDEFMWDMTRCIAQGNGLGDIGATAEDRPKLQIPSNHFDPYTLLAFLELYRKTAVTTFLSAAQEVGDNILTIRFHKGFFVPSDKHIYTKLDAVEALVLLHLDATIRRKGSLVPQVWPSRSLFDWPFRDKERVVDNALIYTLTESPEPPRSLQEAAACGDVVEVMSLIRQGEDVDGKESVLLYTPLYHAVLKGHKDVVDLLLAKGAQVDARDAFPGGTALDYAAENGHKEIAELLIAKGADVNVEDNRGKTPLQVAKEKGHTEIVELLRKHGAKE